MTDDGKQEKGSQNPASERRRSFFGHNSASNGSNGPQPMEDIEDFEENKGRPTKWSMGVLNDPETHEVPGTTSKMCRKP